MDMESGQSSPTGLPLVISGMTIDDLIIMHVEQCDQCQKAIRHMMPKGLGQKTALCDTYLHLQIQRANYEGAVNNIVAYTEHGDEAPKGRPLE